MAKYEASHSMKWVALRYFNVCGAAAEGDIGEDKARPSTLMTMCIYHLLGKRPKLKIFGRDYPTPDGTAIRDYIHPSDLATGHLAALRRLQDTNTSDVFNLGNGKGDSVLQVILAVEKASGKTIKREDAPRRAGDPAISICDPSRANSLLNWTPAFDLDAMAKTAWEWHSKHPDGFATASGGAA
jgi:UDP-glucose 4-epimerase